MYLITTGQVSGSDPDRRELLIIIDNHDNNGLITSFSSVHLLTLYIKRLLPRCIHHFNSDLINNMDHMRISGIEPSSVILSQRK